MLSEWLNWQKSSRCDTGACVEVAWQKSSFCGGGECVEVARPVTGTILMRDSKEPDGAFLVFTADGWSTFVDGVHAGEFDL